MTSNWLGANINLKNNTFLAQLTKYVYKHSPHCSSSLIKGWVGFYKYFYNISYLLLYERLLCFFSNKIVLGSFPNYFFIQLKKSNNNSRKQLFYRTFKSIIALYTLCTNITFYFIFYIYILFGVFQLILENF